ncbi:hypothetical protein NYE69_12595 [Paenibacillus sp. FSL R5-0527]|uniref:hypothetical protein n=1 Tax=Paenibacillus sp. FSL R5-0527 TaxID=2975321 RepID=UPI0030FB0845
MIKFKVRNEHGLISIDPINIIFDFCDLEAKRRRLRTNGTVLVIKSSKFYRIVDPDPELYEQIITCPLSLLSKEEFTFNVRHEKEADRTIKKLNKSLHKVLSEEYKEFTEQKAKIERCLKGVKDHENE